MPNHQVIGLVLIATGVIDALLSLWMPNRLPDERQRAIVRLALVCSGVVVAALGALFFVGAVGAGG